MDSQYYWLKRALLQDSLIRATEEETIKWINEIRSFYSL